MLELLSYPPIFRGFILLIISGFTFPLTGVYILRMNLLPIRYLLMHGVLLGGTLGLVLGWDPSLSSVAINILIIVILNQSSRSLGANYGSLSMFFMVAVVAAASIIMSVFNVPAKDTLTLLWGSLYTSSIYSIIAAGVLGLGLVAFSIRFFRQLTAVFYNKDIARSLGIDSSAFELGILVIISLVVALAMRLMGALLLDALILLPAIIAGFFSSGLKRMMILSSIFGGIFSFAGFGISLYFDISVSSGVAVPAILVFILTLIFRKGAFNETSK